MKEDATLHESFAALGPKWKDISLRVGRPPEACRDRWRKIEKRPPPDLDAVTAATPPATATAPSGAAAGAAAAGAAAAAQAAAAVAPEAMVVKTKRFKWTAEEEEKLKAAVEECRILKEAMGPRVARFGASEEQPGGLHGSYLLSFHQPSFQVEVPVM